MMAERTYGSVVVLPRATTLLRAALVVLAPLIPTLLVRDPAVSRPVALACLAIAAWLTELVPPFVPTLLLLAAAPLVVDGLTLPRVLGWSADPTLALFFGGFALGAAATSTGLDRRMAELVVRAAGGSARRLIVAVAAGGFVTSMWMSGGAAAAVLLTALRPLLSAPGPLRTALLLAVAMGTNFGGLGTPIGAGPNALALAALPAGHTLSFAGWMLLALPLAGGLVAASTAAVLLGYRGPDRVSPRDLADDVPGPERPTDRRQRALVGVFVATVLAWLSEPLHGVPTASVALVMATALFATGLIRAGELGHIDWATLLLIAGGLLVGRLLEHARVLPELAAAVPLGELPAAARTLAIVALAAVLSALMSNTATASLLIPLGAALDPSPALPILIALACGLGVPFTISTPPNALAAGAGLAPRALLRVGLPLMVLGIVVLGLTGGAVLRLIGLG